MRISTKLIAMLVVAGAVPLAGCTDSSEPRPDPSRAPTASTSSTASAELLFPANGSGICADATVPGSVLFAIPLTNSGAGDAKLTGVARDSRAGLGETRFWIVAPGPKDDVIAIYDDPPGSGLLPGWEDRAAVSGTTIAGGRTVTFVIQSSLADGATAGGVTDLEVGWSDGRGSHVETVTGTFGFRPIVSPATPCAIEGL